MQAVLLAPALAEMALAFQARSNPAFLSRLVLIAPAVALVLSASYVGWLVDRIPKTRLLLVGLAIFAACGVLSFLAGTPEQIIAARIVLGISLGALITVSTALIGDFFTGPERDRLLGWQVALQGAVTVISPVVGGAIALIDWRLIFLVNLIALPIMLPVAALPSVPSTARPDRRLNLSPDLLLVCLMGFLGFLFLYLITLQTAFHLVEIGQGGSLAAGIAIGAPALVATACAMQYANVRTRLSYPATGGVAFLLIALGYGIVAAATTMPAVLAGLALSGAGFGLNAPNCSAWLLSKVSPDARGRALGYFATAMFSGQLVSPFIYEPMVNGLGSPGTFAAVAVASVVVALLLALAARREHVIGQGPIVR